MNNAETLKNTLVAIITGSDALSAKQRDDLSEMITNHQGLLIDDGANKFVKAKYLKGRILGFQLGTSERLNTKRLANGINGMIFTCDEISEEELFDENVIVDLSRVGSLETKSLIMGMLVLKLQEYRMAGNMMNVELNHMTVLEEAHNLLRKTSTEQTSESGNLAEKSVEMLTNAIAEMRTYGEGFIIADQAPGLLDMAVIRNTNTKIIMRLPDQTDRELVGKAANLNDDQITELAKLPCGVAAIYQNEWVQPVLCKIDKHKTSDKKQIDYWNKLVCIWIMRILTMKI